MACINLTWKEIVSLIQKIEHTFKYIGPSIHPEIAQELEIRFRKRALKIQVCVCNEEDVYRNGYGNVEAINILKQIGAEIRQVSGLRVGVICFDEKIFAFFQDSRILVGKNSGLNAFEIPSQFADKILGQFFISENNLFKNPEHIPLLSEEFNENSHKVIENSIKENPPATPDLQRQIRVYNTKFQYAELIFEGANISNKKIDIPPNALPFKDADIKKQLQTKLGLFTKEQTDTWTQFSLLKEDLEAIRKRFLKPCTPRKEKSILLKREKSEFIAEVNKLESKLIELSGTLTNQLQQAINKSYDMLEKELGIFFKQNPPDHTQTLDGDLKDRAIKDEINKIMYRIKIPKAHDLISNFKLKTHFYDLTWEDLSDEILVSWFKEKGLISREDEEELADRSNAFSQLNESSLF
jgi:hypothetical protein